MRLLNNPTIEFTFLANDLEPGHNQQQTVGKDYIVREIQFFNQLLNGLKSSSDSVSLQIARRCPAIEDLIATEGDVKAVLKENGSPVFTGYVSTEFSWEITGHGEQALNITLESVGTRLLGQNYINSGKAWLDGTASAVIFQIAAKCGISVDADSLRSVLQPVSKEVEAGKTCRELLDQLCYECNAVYYFNADGVLSVKAITASTAGAEEIDASELHVVDGQAISLSKKLRTYKGSRVSYTELGRADNYLVYRDTTGQDSTHEFCKHDMEPGHWFDGTEDYTSEKWSEATADEFREPAQIGAVNASSESSKVGSGKIISIADLRPLFTVGAGNFTVEFKHAGGSFFEMSVHNAGSVQGYLTRLDLYASIVYEKATSVIRTSLSGATGNKSVLEESMEWIHDKQNAQRHANLVSQYWQNANATYSFSSSRNIALGSVVKLHDNVYTGLNVYVLVYASEWSDLGNVTRYSAVGISTFDLDRDVYYGTVEEAKPSGVQGPPGEPGESYTIEYALGRDPSTPPNSEGLWAGEQGLWGNQEGVWGSASWTRQAQTPQRGEYLWMRTRTGESVWEYTRVTTEPKEITPEFIGVMNTIPTEIEAGLPVMVGDYFVASEDFEEDGTEFKKGVPYVCVDTEVLGGWEEMVFNQENTAKAMTCLGGILNSGIAVPSTAAIYGWFENLVAQNAVIQNLFSQAITILNGGSIQSERYAKDSEGFVIRSDGSAEFNQVSIYGNSVFGANLDCPSFSSLPEMISPTTYNLSGSAQAQYETMAASFISPSSGLLPCTHSTSPDVKYVRLTREAWDEQTYTFYSASMTQVGYIRHYYTSRDRWLSTWGNQSFTINVGGSSNVKFKFKGMTQYSGTMNTGDVYYTPDSDGSTGTLHVKL